MGRRFADRFGAPSRRGLGERRGLLEPAREGAGGAGRKGSRALGGPEAAQGSTVIVILSLVSGGWCGTWLRSPSSS